MNRPSVILEGWQPLTPRGVAAFARLPLRRLFLVQFAFAALAASFAVWFLWARWFPVVDEAIRNLPRQGQIRSGQLDWFGSSSEVLAEGSFLALVVDLNHGGQMHSPAQVQIEFGRNSVRILSLLGRLDCAYPKLPGRMIAFNRPELEPWWGAWKPPICWVGGAIFISLLLLTWAGLATLNSAPVWLLAFFANRRLTWLGSWKLAGAAWMPATLILTSAIALYGLEALDLVGFLFAAAAHFIAGGFYTLLSPWLAPKMDSDAPTAGNPFVLSGEKVGSQSETNR